MAALLLLGVMRVLLMHGEGMRSPTTDEPMHLARGVAYWSAGTTELSYLHPPLANAITSGGVEEALAERIDVTQLRGWPRKDPSLVGGALFEEDFTVARAALAGARSRMAWLAVLLCAYVFAWTRRRWGDATGLVALALCAGHPVLLAHGGLMTTDLPATLATFFVLTQFIAWLEDARAWRVLMLGLACGTLAATKHTALPVGALVGIIALGAAMVRPHPLAGALRTAGHLSIAGLLAILMVNAVYRFENTMLTVSEVIERPEPKNHISRRFDHDLMRDYPRFAADVPVPLPFTYVYGVSAIRHHATMGHSSFFFGHKTRGHPAYFAVMIAIKTPVGLLSMLPVGGWLLWRRRGRMTLSIWGLVAFVIGFVAIASLSGLNLGVRHVMVTFPVLAVLAARSATLAWEELRPRRLVRALVATCVVTAAVAGLWARPNFISHFNVLVGRELGHEISVIGEDWGQDNARLVTWLKEHDIGHVHYATHGRLRLHELRELGQDVTKMYCESVPPPGAWVVLPMTNRVRYLHCYPWQEVCEERARINHHLIVFECVDADGLFNVALAVERRRREKEEAKQVRDPALSEVPRPEDDRRTKHEKQKNKGKKKRKKKRARKSARASRGQSPADDGEPAPPDEAGEGSTLSP